MYQMRKWLIVVLILACGLFLFEPLLENFVESNTIKHTNSENSKCKDNKCQMGRTGNTSNHIDLDSHGSKFLDLEAGFPVGI